MDLASPAPRTHRMVGDRNVQISETPGKPLLLLVRMAARGMGVWDGVWDRLAELFTVAQFDLPAPDLDRTDDTREIFRAYARMCVEVAAGLGHERFHIFGWTGGTHVAIHALIAYPQHIQSCVLLGPVCALPDNRVVEHGLGVQRLLLDKSLEDYTYSWILSGLSWDYTLDHYDRIDTIVRDRMAADKGRLDTERVFKWIRALRFPSYTDTELEAITTPTFIAVQEFDRWPSLAMARRLNGLIPDSELGVVHGGGALVLMEAPEKFMATAGRFLRAAAAGPRAPRQVIRQPGQVEVLRAGIRTGAVEHQASTAVVFLHGWLMGPAMWSEAIAQLGPVGRCVALWQPGHGPSTAPPHGITMAQWADWVITNLDGLGITRAVLVGHSMGGLLAQAVLRRHPSRVSGLVLVGIQDTPWPRQRGEDFCARAAALASQWSIDLARTTAERLLGPRLLERDAGILGRFHAGVQQHDLHGLPHLAHAIATRPDFSEEAPPAQVPTLVVHGTGDTAIDIAAGRAMARRIPGARFVAMPDAGHCLPLEEPTRFAQALGQFLRRHRLPGAGA
jgi:3-oxoadipate enol-lactonase